MAATQLDTALNFASCITRPGSIVGLVNCVDNVGGFVAPTITEAITGYSVSILGHYVFLICFR